MMTDKELRDDGSAEAGAKFGAFKRRSVIPFTAICVGIVGGRYLITALWISPETGHGDFIALGISTGVVLLAIEIARRTPLRKYLL